MVARSRAGAGIAIAGVVLATTEAARPRYGGVFRVETQAPVQSLDPLFAATDPAEVALRARVTPLVFESLVGVDGEGGLRPLLAAAWERDQRAGRWRFRLRPSVKLHDGSTLDATRVAAVLGARERAWRIGANADTVVIETDRPRPDLPWELADSRFAIAVRTAAGELQGSGAFRIERLEPRRLVLRAFEDHWAGRPFVDTLQIEEGRSAADQMSDVEQGRADFVAIRPADLRRIAQRGLRTAQSRPIELFAMVFEPHRSVPIDEPVRLTIAAAIDRSALAAVVLQRQAEPAFTLLPSWLSGYAASLVAESRPALSRTAVAQLAPERRTFVLRVDPADPVAQEIAARASVNARDAGVTMTVQAPAGLAPRPDARLVRIRLDATTPDRALGSALTAFGPRLTALAGAVPVPGSGAPLESVLTAEAALLEHGVVVPLVHARELYALGERVELWNGPAVLGSGAWNLANMWIRPEPARTSARP